MTACVAASMSSSYPGMNDHFWKPGLYRDLKMKRKRVSDICKVEMFCRRQDNCNTTSDVDSAYSSDLGFEDLASPKLPKLTPKLEQENTTPTKLNTSQNDLIATWKSQKANSNLIMPFYSLSPGTMLRPQQLVSITASSNCQTSIQFIPVISDSRGQITTPVSSNGQPLFVASQSIVSNCNQTNYLSSSSSSSISPLSDINFACINERRRNVDQFSSTNSDTSANPPMKPCEKPLKEQDFIAHYTNGQFKYNGHLLDNPHNRSDAGQSPFLEKKDKGHGVAVMVCAICQDRATGLHYGIITCEGCKGFFKRTVQNKRIYSCVANGNCEINRIQRNRCQFCRFKKCLEKGMVLAAVREDRMPGGRNSGAVYNLYKVKYKKHKKREIGLKKICYQEHLKNNGLSALPESSPCSANFSTSNLSSYSSLRNMDSFEQDFWPSGLSESGDASPNRLDRQLNTSPYTVQDLSRSHQPPPVDTKMEDCKHLLLELVNKDTLLGIAKSYGLEQLHANQDTAGQALCEIGDDIVIKLVHWIRSLPFYTEIPLKLQSQMLTKKWHELLLLIMTAFGAMDSQNESQTCPLFTDLFKQNITKVQWYLNKTFGNTLSTQQLNKEVGPVIEKVTQIMLKFLSLRLSRQEFVCLQVIILLSQNDDMGDPAGKQMVAKIQERYMKALQLYTKTQYSDQPYRFGELLLLLPQIQDASAMLLKSKMIYIPFLLNT